jgi:uncharacterized membrane protein
MTIFVIFSVFVTEFCSVDPAVFGSASRILFWMAPFPRFASTSPFTILLLWAIFIGLKIVLADLTFLHSSLAEKPKLQPGEKTLSFIFPVRHQLYQIPELGLRAFTFDFVASMTG